MTLHTQSERGARQTKQQAGRRKKKSTQHTRRLCQLERRRVVFHLLPQVLTTGVQREKVSLRSIP